MSRQTNVTRKSVVNSPDRKPSVFERLGTKSNLVSQKNVCSNWALNGTCPLNKQCKLAQSHVLISPSKRSKSERMKKSLIGHKKCKDDHKKSVLSHHNSEVEWEGWELGDLEDADEKVLEKRKQELQRELQLQLKKEKELTRKKEKRIEKKRAASTSSSSSTSTESSSSSSSTSSSSSEPRKRANRKRKHSSSSSESVHSFHRQKKAIKTTKTKLTAARKPGEKKDGRVADESKGRNVVSSKKSTGQKKSYSPAWDKSRGRSPAKQQNIKKSPPRSPNINNKTKSSSPRYEKASGKNKGRNYSPKAKSKDPSPKRGAKKSKDSNVHVKEKSRQSSPKSHSSPSRSRKASPSRSRRYEESSEKRRGHYEDTKHTSRKDRSREKDRKREVRGRSSEYDNNGGLKKGGKILPLKPVAYNKEEGSKKEMTRCKSSERNASDAKAKDNVDKDRNRVDRERDKGDRDKAKSERDKNKRKKSGDDHDRRPPRERESEKNNVRNRDERGREREGTERGRYAKERDSDRQKERDEALERCRERQRERERLDKERKEKEERKHQRDSGDNRGNHERELPSLLDLKAETPNKTSVDIGMGKPMEKVTCGRDSQRNSERASEKSGNQERDRSSPCERDHDRRDQSTRKPGGGGGGGGGPDREQESRRNREGGEFRNASADLRRSLGEGRRGPDEGRQWDDARRPSSDGLHDRRRTLDSTNGERRQYSGSRRPQEEAYKRHGRSEPEADLRDFPHDDRRSGRYDHKWINREETRDEGWSHYSRRGPRETWNGDWPQDQSRPPFSETERCHPLSESVYSDQNSKGRSGPDSVMSAESAKDKGPMDPEPVSASSQRPEKPPREEGDALSDISDDPDDILNRDDYPAEEQPSINTSQNLNQQIYIRSNEFLFEQRRPLLECLGERSLDFEEISDEELEEEARATRGGIADVLGADWAGLLRETRPKDKRLDGEGSAHRRWTTRKLILATGISFKYAGESFSRKYLADCINAESNGSDGEKQISSNSDKENENKNEDENLTKEEGINFIEKNVKMPMEEDVSEVASEIFHEIPGLHAVLREARRIKSSLFTSHTRFKRGLSARTDLALRRELCNLPLKEPLHFTPPLDNKMFEASVQQFFGGSTTAAV